MEICLASQDDIDLLIRLRLDFLNAEFGQMNQNVQNRLEVQLRGFFTRHLINKSVEVLYMKEDGEVTSTVFMVIQEKPASPAFINGLGGTIINVYTYPNYRRRGFATVLMNEMIKIARDRGVDAIDLTATKDGLEVYKKLQFQTLDYPPMRLNLNSL